MCELGRQGLRAAGWRRRPCVPTWQRRRHAWVAGMHHARVRMRRPAGPSGRQRHAVRRLLVRRQQAGVVVVVRRRRHGAAWEGRAWRHAARRWQVVVLLHVVVVRRHGWPAQQPALDVVRQRVAVWAEGRRRRQLLLLQQHRVKAGTLLRHRRRRADQAAELLLLPQLLLRWQGCVEARRRRGGGAGRLHRRSLWLRLLRPALEHRQQRAAASAAGSCR